MAKTPRSRDSGKQKLSWPQPVALDPNCDGLRFPSNATREEVEHLVAQHFGWNIRSVEALVEKCGKELRLWVPSTKETRVSHPRAHVVGVLHLDELNRFHGRESLRNLKRENLRVVAERVHAVHYLTSVTTPFYSLPELADEITAFASFVSGDLRHILETGFPSRHWTRSRWLDEVLGRLYFVRHAPTLRMRGASGETNYTTTTPFQSGTRLSAAEKEVTSYEGAPLVRGMSTMDAARLEELRPTLQEIKLRLLDNAAAILGNHTDTSIRAGVLRDLLADLGRSLTADAAEFLFRMDRFYTGEAAAGDRGEFRDDAVEPGGLSSMLSFAAWVDKEIEIGALAACKSILDRHQPPLRLLRGQGDDHLLRAFLAASGQPIPERVAVRSYYEAFGKSWRPTLDAALDAFLGRIEPERDHLEEARAQIESAMRTNLDERLSIALSVPSSHAPLLRPVVQQAADRIEKLGRQKIVPTVAVIEPKANQKPTIIHEVMQKLGVSRTTAYSMKAEVKAQKLPLVIDSFVRIQKKRDRDQRQSRKKTKLGRPKGRTDCG